MGGCDLNMGLQMTIEIKLKDIAYHEAGHALLSYKLRKEIEFVTIIPNKEEGYLGCVQHLKTEKNLSYVNESGEFSVYKKDRPKIEKNVMIYCAGHIAEIKYTKEVVEEINVTDFQYVLDFLVALSDSDKESEAYLNWLYTKTETIINKGENWYAVEALANELLVYKELDGKETVKIIRDAIRKFKHEEMKKL